jgi:hypothetical protein
VPEFFTTQLQEGSTQVSEQFSLPSPAEVRSRSEHRVRRRRAQVAGASVAVVLVMSGAAFGLARQSGSSAAAAGATTPATVSPRPQATSTVSAPAAASVTVRLDPPAQYAGTTANRVGLTIANPGPARNVAIEFSAAQTQARYWVESCDSSVDGGCSSGAIAANPLKVAKGADAEAPGVVKFDLALPTGTTAYTVWVSPPNGVTSYTASVLDGTEVLGQTGSGQIGHSSFPTLTTLSQSPMAIHRGGSAVEFDTKVTDDTTASYVNLFSFTTLTCNAGQNTMTVPQSSYTLEWNAGADWQAIGPSQLGQISFQLTPGEASTTQFRLALSDSLPSDVTNCQIKQLVSATDMQSAPYYDTTAPNAQTTVDFTVE